MSKVWVGELYDNNYKDSVFAEEVRRFMRDFMPHFPLGLLEVNDIERWEVAVNNRDFVVEEVECSTWTCAECETVYYEEVTVCGSCNHTEGVSSFTQEAFSGYVVRDCRYSSTTYVDSARWSDRVIEIEGQRADFYEDEAEAQELADRSYADEPRDSYGFPWANMTAYRPDDHIDTTSLHAAGFVVAEYTGGDGDRYRLCGIDGGGYSFEDHFVRLYVAHAEDKGWTTKTQRGEVHVSAKDDRDPLIRLAEASAV